MESNIKYWVIIDLRNMMLMMSMNTCTVKLQFYNQKSNVLGKVNTCIGFACCSNL